MERPELLHELLQATNSTEPFVGLVRAMATQCGGSAVIFDRDHEVIAAAGGAPRSLAKARLAQVAEDRAIVGLGRWFVCARSIGVRAQTYFVCLLSRDQSQLQKVVDDLFEALAALLGSVSAIEGTSLAQRAVNSVKIIQDLEIGILVSQEPSYWRRLEQFGYVPFTNAQIVLCTIPSSQDGSVEHIEETLSVLRQFAADKPILVAESSIDSWQILVPTGMLVDELIDIVADTFVTAISEPFVSLSIYPEMYRATRVALRHAEHQLVGGIPDAGHIVYVQTMSPIDWMISASVDRLDMSVLSRYGSVLRRDEELLQSLLEYFAAHFDVAAAAKTLAVHPNTLRYRLQKIERKLDGSLSDPWTVSNLCLSFHSELQAMGG